MYKRNQVELVLWQLFKEGHRGPIPDQFFNRIKRLLDLDRTAAKEKTSPGMGFTESTLLPGKGADRAFSELDVFCLSIALDMVDMGYKQSEAVFFVQHKRAGLSGVHQRICSELPHIPNYRVRLASEQAVFMVFRQTEFKELSPNDNVKQFKGPIIIEPRFYFGEEELMDRDELPDTLNRYRKSTIFELSKTLCLLKVYLAEAEEIKRGAS